MNRVYKFTVLSFLIFGVFENLASTTKYQKPVMQKKQVIEEPEQLYLIDTIKAVVYGPEDTAIITLSDTKRPSFDGTTKTLDDLILETRIYQDAARYQMLPKEDAVDSHLQAVQRENNLSLDDLKEIFKNAGYTYEEGRNQFRTMTAVSTMLDFRIRSRLIVPDKEIQAYYQEHPLLQEESYQIERAVARIPEHMELTQFRNEIESLCKKNICSLDIDWAEPFWVNKSELAADKNFITTMNVGSVAMGSDKEDEVELFKLNNKKDEHLVCLQDRYQEIIENLKRPKFVELLDKYKQELFNSAGIIYY